jgi:N-acetylmuramoyl-L-alanine amidase
MIFWVLRHSAMPSVLIETGYLSNAEEEDFLNSAEGQATFAQSVFRAFQEYKESVEGSSHAPLLAANPINFNHKRNQWKQPMSEEAKMDKKIFERSGKEETPKKETIVTIPIINVGKENIVKEKNKRRSSDVDTDKITFHVQLASSDRKENTRQGKWASAGTIIIKKEGNLFKYLSNDFSQYEEANQESKRLRNLGFDGVFVVAYKGDKRMSLQEAMR